MGEEEVGSWFKFLEHSKFGKGWHLELIAGSLFVAFLVVSLTSVITRKIKYTTTPSGAQNLLEAIVEFIQNLLSIVMERKKAQQFLPLICVLFVYILAMNMVGLLLPGMKSPTANLNTTLSLAIVVFILVQYYGVKTHGFWGYIKVLSGGLRWQGGLIEALLLPIRALMLVLHFMGALGGLAIMLSLSIRLYGNIYGKEAVLSTFAAQTPMVMFPLWLLTAGIGLLISGIQAFVFALLASIYITIATSEH